MKNKNILICLFLTACGSSSSKVEYQADAGGMGGMVDASQPGSPDARMEVADAAPVSPDAMTCTADIMNDSSNCGACGHGCLESTCSNGQCIARPVTEIDSFYKMGDYHIDQNDIYFAAFKKGMTQNPNNLWKKGIDSSTPSISFVVFNQNAPVNQFAVSGSSFWLPNRLGQFNDGAIQRVSTSWNYSILVKDLVESTTSNTMFYGDFIYWASGATGNGVGSIKKISVNGGVVSTVTTTPTGVIFKMATDGTNIYFTSDSATKKVPISSGPVTQANANELDSFKLTDGDWTYEMKSSRSPSGIIERSVAAISKSNPGNIIVLVGTRIYQVSEECREINTPESPKVYGQYVYFITTSVRSCTNTAVRVSQLIERVAKM